MLVITHKDKIYWWLGDYFGQAHIWKCEICIRDDQVYFVKGNWVVVHTCHTPDQLVRLWYMVEIKDEWELINGWQPTTWEFIDVSNDGEKWEEEKYTFMRMKWNYYECTNGSTWYVWKFARPITEEVIVPPVIEPHNSKDIVEFRESEFTAYIGLHMKVNELVDWYKVIAQWIHSQSNK